MKQSIKILPIFIIFLYSIGIFFVFCNESELIDDMHSSIPILEEVLNGEGHLMGNLESYITKSEDLINSTKSFLAEYKKMQNDSLSGLETEDRLKSHLLKNRIIINFFGLQNHLRTVSKMVKNFTKAMKIYNLPTASDLVGVTLGLLRIQEVYEISAEQIANGTLSEIDFKTKFTAADCFQVGSTLSKLHKNYYAIQWFKVALQRLTEEGWKGITPQMNENSILDVLALSQYWEGSVESSKASVESALSSLSHNFDTEESIQTVSNLKTFISNHIDLKQGIKKPRALNPPLGALTRHNITELELLKKSCRGQLIKTPAEQRELFCKYERENHPFLILAPIKVEVLNLDPYLVVLHEVLYDAEIEILKELSKGKLVRAGVFNESNGASDLSPARTSKLVWLDEYEHPLIPTLDQRVSDMTGLSMETSEVFQLMNYGIGGHYDIHTDVFKEPNEKNNVQSYESSYHGNRIATVLFYMSDVPQGGGTSWPYIKVLTLPKKGSAAFWYNMYADGKPNLLTRHAACPIIIGSKWVVNKWIRVRGQVFRKPCLTYPDSIEANTLFD